MRFTLAWLQWLKKIIAIVVYLAIDNSKYQCRYLNIDIGKKLQLNFLHNKSDSCAVLPFLLRRFLV